MRNNAAKLFIFLFFVSAAVPVIALANGGDQRVVDGKYLINLSRAPFTPRVGVETSFLISFVDLARDKLIAEDIAVTVRIAKLGGGGGSRAFVFEKRGIEVNGGVMELKYTFAETGLHEIFFDFAFAANPDNVLEAPDFLLDVQKSETQPPISRQAVPWMLGGITLGFLVGWFLKRRLKTAL